MNWNDNEVYCGGFGVQWAQNQGRCGVCGDDYRDEVPRQHETGGKFGNEIITATYTAGDTLDIEVEIVSNHWGFFVLKVCPMTEPGEIASQACLDQHPLEVVKTGDRSLVQEWRQQTLTFASYNCYHAEI